MKSLELSPCTTEALTPQEFLGVYLRERHKLAGARVVPPTLGRPGFGRVVVERTSPVFRLGGKGAFPLSR